MLTPVATTVMSSVAQGCAGGKYTCALAATYDGGLYCWGLNTNGQVEHDHYFVPFPPPILDGRVLAEAVCDVVVSFPQLGQGSTAQFNSPPASPAMTGIEQVVCGAAFVCALQEGTGGVFCWVSRKLAIVFYRFVSRTSGFIPCSFFLWLQGINDKGQLGNNLADTQLNSPPASPLITGVVDLDVGAQHVCVLLQSNGGVVCWGYVGVPSS